MNKNHRIIGSSICFVLAAILIGYGFTAIDFSFSDDRWSRNGDRTSNFPLIGTMPTESAFLLGMFSLLGGFAAITIGAHLAVVNYSTVKYLGVIIGGVLLFAWGIWGIAFSFNTVEWRIQHGIDRVEIPCLGFCAFTSEQWLLINFAMMTIGLLMITLATKASRYITKRTPA